MKKGDRSEEGKIKDVVPKAWSSAAPGSYQRNPGTMVFEDATSSCSRCCSVAAELLIGLSKLYVMQSCLGRASLRAINRARITLNRYDLSCRTYEPAQQHRYVSDTSAKIQDALPRTNPGSAEESLRNWASRPACRIKRSCSASELPSR